MAHLIKFVVVRQVLLRHIAQHFSVICHSRTVIQLAVKLHRQADYSYHIKLRQFFQNRYERILSTVKERCLIEQILTGVTRDAQFRKNCELYIFFSKLLCQRDYLLCVVLTVGNLNLRCCRRYFYKSVFHIVLFGLRLKIRNCLSFRRPFFLSRLKYRRKLFPS